MLLFSSIVIWVLLISCENVYCQNDTVDWCYRPEKICNFIPPEWGNGFPTCNGAAQSPIPIDFTSLDALSLTRKDLSLSKSYSDEQSFTLENTGRLLFLRPSQETRLTGSLVAGDIFTFNSASFHYGTADNGSEHVINGQQYAMEVHFSHSNGNDAGKTIIFSVLFHISDNDNDALTAITNVLENVIQGGTQTEGSGLALAKFFKPPQSGSIIVPIVRYTGSSPFPGCQEGIDWYVLLVTQPISQSQLEIFQALQNYAGAPLGDNCRPVQPLNGRNLDFSGVSILTEEDGPLPELLG